MSSQDTPIHQGINLYVAPYIEVQACKLTNININNIVGLTHNETKEEEEKAITLVPIPIAIRIGNMYEILPHSSLWREELAKAHASHLTCIELSSDIDSTILDNIKLLIFNVLSNRTLHGRRDIYDTFFHDKRLQEAIRYGYGLSPNDNPLSRLLGKNIYSDKQARRICTGDRHATNVTKRLTKNDQKTLHVMMNYDVSRHALIKWDAEAQEAGYLSFAEIIMAFEESIRPDAVEWMNKCENEERHELHKRWLKINDRMLRDRNKGAAHG